MRLDCHLQPVIASPKLVQPSEPADDWTRIAGSTQVLIRSRIEIAAVLQTLVDGNHPLVSHHQVHDRLFIADLRRVCAEQNLIVVGYSDNKTANAGVFAAGAILFRASHPKGCVGFMASHPVEQDDPLPGIRFDFPDVLFVEQRRAHQRIQVVPETKLNCLADAGGITPFDARIVDIGLSGLGFMVYDPTINLQPGTVLTGCRIDLPDGGVACVDIRVMNSVRLGLRDGKSACRAGCRFIGDADMIDKLLKVFVLDLERHDGERGD